MLVLNLHNTIGIFCNVISHDIQCVRLALHADTNHFQDSAKGAGYLYKREPYLIVILYGCIWFYGMVVDELTVSIFLKCSYYAYMLLLHI